MVPVALIQEIGAYAGLIALPALVLLAVLHLSQARDVRRLREWAGRAPEREAEASRGRVAPPRASVTEQAAPPQPISPPPSVTEPFAPGVSEPPPPDLTEPTARAVAPQTAAASSTATAARPLRTDERAPAWAANEHFGVRSSSLRRALLAVRRRPLIPLIAGTVAAAIAIAAVLLADGGSASRPAAAPVAQPSVSVAVLNATGVAGLGHKVGTRLSQAGYRIGTVGDAGARPGTASVVLYSPGDAQPAQLVARSLGVARTSPADAASQSKARGAPVVVVVGADLSH